MPPDGAFLRLWETLREFRSLAHDRFATASTDLIRPLPGVRATDLPIRMPVVGDNVRIGPGAGVVCPIQTGYSASNCSPCLCKLRRPSWKGDISTVAIVI